METEASLFHPKDKPVLAIAIGASVGGAVLIGVAIFAAKFVMTRQRLRRLSQPPATNPHVLAGVRVGASSGVGGSGFIELAEIAPQSLTFCPDDPSSPASSTASNPLLLEKSRNT